VLAGAVTTFGTSARAGATLEERKLPMKFNWVACEPNCRGWVSAVGIITADTPKDFEEFARDRQLGGATVVLDSSGGSVNDAITLGRRFRNLGLLTTVGISLQNRGVKSAGPAIAPEAYCESMCVFLLLAGKTRYVPESAHVRVHQIWMGDRADDAKAASYSAQDLMIVERDLGRLAKYTFDMGGAGDLLSLALSVPPWEDLHELDAAELKQTNLVTTDLCCRMSTSPRPRWRSLRRRRRRGSARSRTCSPPSRPRRQRPWCPAARCKAAARRSRTSGASSIRGVRLAR
jgi:hypothetical protein